MEGVTHERFGERLGELEITRYTLTNRRGSVARLIDLGAALTELWVPDRTGGLGDVVLGFDSAEAYASDGPYFGSTVGRVANRIADARFELDGARYRLAANDGEHHLHGGVRGFDKAVWVGRSSSTARGPAVEFRHTSPDEDEGYPGSLHVTVTFVLQHDDTLHINYKAHCDAPTLINLTNHSYWNLAGDGDVLAHELELTADRYTETRGDLIPTGRLLPVANTPFDFTVAKRIGRDLPELKTGYDHNFVLATTARAEPVLAAVLYDPATGRRMRVATTEPGLQLYTGHFLDGVEGKRGAYHRRHAGLCLEAQRFPDATHHPAFPTVVLRPGETYQQVTVHSFEVE